MNPYSSPEVRWLDFSGAPPLLIPRVVADLWRGVTDIATGDYRDLDRDNPVTDYDRACAAVWPGTSAINFMGTKPLVLHTEFDLHTWDGARQIVACGGCIPSDEELRQASWTKPIRWRAEHSDYLLMNSAFDAVLGLRDEDFMPVVLAPGDYSVDYCDIESEYVGGFHRFTRADHA